MDMKKHAIIIHGWDGSPEDCWFPYLKQELEKRGFDVDVPAMPSPNHPKMQEWVSKLHETIKVSDENTFLIGHSIGCQTILRYLDALKGEEKIGGVVLVAGWVTLYTSAISTREEKQIAKPWIEAPFNWQNVKKRANYFTAIFSDNDKCVPLEHNKITFEINLNAKTIIEHEKGHFSGEDNIKELPSALNAVLEMSRLKL